MISIEVKRAANESNTSVLRRFSKRVQVAGIVRKTKARRAAERVQSHYKLKKAALKRLKRRHDYERGKKLGLVGNVLRHQ